jgi:adenylate kinase
MKAMEIIKIAILGPQGSGKGTQAELISQKYELFHIDMGQELRKRQQVNDDFGNMIKEKISRGELLSDEIPYKIFSEKLLMHDSGYIVDGFPRVIEQLRLAEQITIFDLAIYVKISDDESVRRLEKRRICDKCGKIYIWKEGMDNKCECSGNIIQRVDDTPEAIRKRLILYHENTELLIREYSDRGILVEINGEQDIKDVFNDICLFVDEKISTLKTQ